VRIGRACGLLLALACQGEPDPDATEVAVDEEGWFEDVLEDQFEIGHHRALATGDLSLGPAPAGDLLGRDAQACGAQGPTAPGAFARQPYLQRTSATGTAILWTGSSATVHLWSPDQRDEHRLTPTRDASPYAEQWIAEAEGLRPGAAYCYQLVDREQRVFGPVGFRTAPAQPTQIRALVFGDMGYRTIDQRAVYDQLLRAPVELALLTGDVAYDSGTPAEIEQNLFAVYAPILARVPAFIAAGNHDYRTEGGAPMRAAFALPENGGEVGRERWYWFDWGPLHIVVIDTQYLVPAQLSWLETALPSQRPWTIAVFHRPPFSAGDHGDAADVKRAIHPILARHRVPLAFAGHDHSYERTVPIDGVTYVVTGGGGRGTKKVGKTERTAFSTRVSHHVLLEADASELRLWAVDASGNTFDSTRLSR
jgi:3',5'-cyclic AMP phosphodiesterase CpdA